MKHILVPYDGSAQATKAFELALQFSVKFQSAITVLSVTRLPDPPEDEETETIIMSSKIYYQKLFKKLQYRAKKFSLPKINFEHRAGHPAEQIIYCAEEFDIDHIVMGHRGSTFFKRWLLGSIAKQVMIYAHCAITIVR